MPPDDAPDFETVDPPDTAASPVDAPLVVSSPSDTPEFCSPPDTVMDITAPPVDPPLIKLAPVPDVFALPLLTNVPDGLIPPSTLNSALTGHCTVGIAATTPPMVPFAPSTLQHSKLPYSPIHGFPGHTISPPGSPILSSPSTSHFSPWKILHLVPESGPKEVWNA
ncbi:hypothetical protein PMIN03_003932 [Paraphaeosphaeria minitans]